VVDPALTPELRARPVRETPSEGFPAVVHPEWGALFPWLVQGTTTSRDGAAAFDLGLFRAESPAGEVVARWERLREWTGAGTLVHARQVHGADLRWHEDEAPGLRIAPSCDLHATTRPGILLTVGLADCVPAFLVDPRRRAVALVHAGWRGTAAGALERAIEELGARAESRPGDLHVHLGPAICGACYEVGPEVFEALGVAPAPEPAPIDLRAVLAERAAARGVRAERVTVSEHCTRCDEGGASFFSHRRGEGGRHVAFLGLRA